jgi:D-alanyl-D-alanine carboxypeptidase
MADQKQDVTSKDEKAGKPVTAEQKPAVMAPASTAAGNDPAAKAASATPTKMELATEIYKRMRTVKDVTRKDIIEKFIAEVRLTKAGASTYYQMIKDKHEPQGKK